MNTTQMLDKSLAVLDALLTSNVVSKAIDLLHFFVREHVLAKIQSVQQEHPDLAGRPPKRAFMANGAAGERRPPKRTRSA